MTSRIGLIWAEAAGGVIGAAGGMPWHVPEDLAHFREVTLGHPVVMGRRTWESFPDRFRPLPGRRNIVVTRNAGYAPAGAKVAADLEAALVIAAEQCRVDGKDRVFIAGGAGIYQLALEVATHLYMTEIDAEVEGDTFFPEVDWSSWRCVSREDFPADPQHAWPFSISVWERSSGRAAD